MRGKMRQVILFSAILLLSACFGFDPYAGLERKGVIVKNWDAGCLRRALEPLGKVTINEVKSRDPNSILEARLVKETEIYTHFSDADMVAMRISRLGNDGAAFEQSWGRMGYKVQRSEASAAIGLFERQVSAIKKACGVDIYVIETVVRGGLEKD